MYSTVHVPRNLPVALSTPVSFAWRALPLRSMFTVVFLLLLTVRAEQQSGRSDVGRRLQQQVRLVELSPVPGSQMESSPHTLAQDALHLVHWP